MPNKNTQQLPSTIFLGADHGGFELKEQLKKWLEQIGAKVVDCGAFELDSTDDYPLFAAQVAQKVASNSDSLGMLICRSGGGMTIAANKIRGIRAVEVFDVRSAVHAREHNHANVISLGGDYLKYREAQSVIQAFIDTQPSNDQRHLRRIDQIKQLE